MGTIFSDSANSRAWQTELWHLHLTYGLLCGVGHSLALFCGVVLMNRWFKKWMSVASGVGNIGAGVGTVICGLFVPQLMESSGWRVTMRILALITAV